MKILTIIFEFSLSLCAVIILNNALLPDNLGFINIFPHPYWLPVLIFSLRYPMIIALIAAMIYSGVYSVQFYYSPHCIDLDYFLEFKNSILAISFPFVAFLISSTVNTHKQKIRQLEEKKIKLKDTIDSMGKILRFDENLNRELEHKIINQTNTISKVFDIAKIMEISDIKVLFSRLLEVIHFHLNVKKSTVYFLENGQITDTVCKGFDNRRLSISNFSPQSIIHKCIEEKRIFWINDLPVDDSYNDKDPICCGPVLLPDNSLFALICIYSIPFVSINQENIQSFSTLLEWTGRSIIKHLELKKKNENEMYDIQTDIFTFSFMEKIFQRELKHFQEHKEALSIVIFHFSCTDKLDIENIRIIIYHLIADIINAKESISEYKIKNSFFILLPDVNKKQANQIVTDIKKEISLFYNEFINNGLLKIKCKAMTIDRKIPNGIPA
jgi:hypothetical protein